MEINKSIYAERYWIPKGSSIELADGFFNPETAGSNASEQLVNYYHSLNINVPCMVLLGPPGIGKSTELQRVKIAACEQGYEAAFASLAGIYTPDALEDILNGSANKQAGQPFFLFLDALDESPVTVPVVQQWIIRTAESSKSLGEKYGRNILIRLSSRTADWSEQFEEQLRGVWGKDSVQVYELAPFSRNEVISIVEKQTLRASDFITAVEEEDSSALASRPVTLHMLVNSFLTSGSLNSEDKVGIYRRGVLALLEESNQTRRSSGAVGELDAEARFVIACRIAAASELSTKVVIWDGLYSDSVPSHAIPISEIAGGVEQAFGNVINVTAKNIRETLRTGLFRPVAENTYEWAHKTFSEFLAAYYIKENGTTKEKIFSLIRSGLPGNDHVVPQLREVAAWLSARDHQVWEDLVAQEPGLLLSSDVALQSDKDRKVLVGELIKKLDSLETYDKSEWRSYYKRLNHSELAAQLAPIILDKTKNIVVRRTAIDIAEACLRIDLIKDLKQVAFDELENDHIRAQATHGLIKILPSDQLQDLIPLAIQPQGDANDEIKGWALTALWPNHLTTRQLFSALTVPKEKSYIGSYSLFLYTLKFPALDAEDALAGIEWLNEELFRDDPERSFSKIIPELLSEVWKIADDPSVLEKLANFVVGGIDLHSRLHYEDDLKTFQTKYSNDSPARRRALVLSVFKVAPKNWTGVRQLTYMPWRVVVHADLTWLVDELLDKSGEWPDEWLINLILALIYWERNSETEYIFSKSEKHEGLKRALDSISSVPLDSDLAKWKQSDYKKKELAKTKRTRVPRKETILELLTQCEGEKPGVFWLLNLALLEDAAGRIDESTAILSPSPGWDELSSVERQRLVSAAKRYVTEYRVSEGYLQPNTHHRPAAAGYRAIRLLFAEDQDTYKKLSAENWSAWALPILAFSTSDGESEQEKQRQIAQDCFHNAPDAFLSAVTEYLKITNGIYQVVHLVKGWANEALLEKLWNVIDSPDIGNHEKESTFAELVAADYRPAIKLGHENLKEILSEEQGDIDKEKIYRAATIIACDPNSTWQYLCQIVEAKPDAGRSLIALLANKWRYQKADVDKRSTALQQAQLYVWIETLFQKRPETGSARFLDSTDQTVHFQEALLRNLIGQGTSESVAAVSWIADQLPHVEWLRWSLADARENQRRVEWVPLSPRNAIQKILERIIETPVISDKEKIVEDALDGVVLRENDVRIDFAKSVAEVKTVPVTEPVKPAVKYESLTYLVVNDEWNSKHGGISTFNRQICIALTDHGHKVFCFIPRASQADIDQAKRLRVEIVTASERTGLTNDALLARGPRDRARIKPDAVIGHDHITGAQAHALARDEFNCPYLHFIHTSPEEIEPYKDTDEKRNNGIVNYSKSSAKGKIQADLCADSNIVLAVGPKLARFIRTNLAGKKNDECIISVLPGFNRDLLSYRRPSGRELDLYCLMTGRLEDPLIKGADLFVRIAGVFQGSEVKPELRRASFIMRGFNAETINEDVAKLARLYNVDTYNIRARKFTTDENELIQELKSASLYLMPSKTEGFGLSGLEAIAAGIPTIVSSESGLGETLETISLELQANLKRIASDCVLDTRLREDELLHLWVEQVSKRLSNPDTAFAEADDLRDALKSKFTWTAAAETITKATLLALRG